MSIPNELHKSFILGGNSKVTFTSLVTGSSLTYKVKVSNDNESLFFVSTYVDSEYQYIGIIRNNVFSSTAKSKLPFNSKEVQSFKFVFERVILNTLNGVEIKHCGQCAKCARELTDPESIASGFGPICYKNITGLSRTVIKLSDYKQLKKQAV